MKETFQRIAVVGLSGAGKSTFSRKLAAKTGLPLYFMDTLYWSPDWVETKEEVWREQEQAILDRDQWIVEGWMKSTDRLKKCDLVIDIDVPAIMCTVNYLSRWWQHRKQPRPEMPSGCSEKLDLYYFSPAKIHAERQAIENALAEFPDKCQVRLASRRQAEDFLNNWPEFQV